MITKNHMTFLDGKYVESAIDEIYKNYMNVYAAVEKNDIGRSKFVVGNAINRVCKPLFEIYIEYSEEDR